MEFKWYHVATCALALILLVAIATVMQGPPYDRDVLYQVSAMELLANGSYDGIIMTGDLGQHGDFGIGTFEGLNGEMVVTDGSIYQITADGAVHAVNGTVMVPFAEVTYFDPDTSVHIDGPDNFSTLTAALNDKLPSKDVFYAVRIHGTFPYVKARSVPAQSKPYPPLSEVVKNQSVFELYNVTGTVVGIYSPGYVSGVGSPGFHLHFISDERKSGGHVLDLTASNTDVQLDGTPGFYMSLPGK